MMRAGRTSRSMARLADLQRLARDEHRQGLARSCTTTNERAAEEWRAGHDLGEAVAALDAVFARPSLCIDSLSLAARRLQLGETGLEQARRATLEASSDEDAARARLSETEHRLRFVRDITRTLERKHADKRARTAIEEAIAISLAKGSKP